MSLNRVARRPIPSPGSEPRSTPVLSRALAGRAGQYRPRRLWPTVTRFPRACSWAGRAWGRASAGGDGEGAQQRHPGGTNQTPARPAARWASGRCPRMPRGRLRHGGGDLLWACRRGAIPGPGLRGGEDAPRGPAPDDGQQGRRHQQGHDRGELQLLEPRRNRQLALPGEVEQEPAHRVGHHGGR